MTAPLQARRHEAHEHVTGSTVRKRSVAPEQYARPRQARPPGSRAGAPDGNAFVAVPVEVIVFLDRDGWHVGHLPRDVDLEAVCDAQDAEDAAWFAQRAPVIVCARPNVKAAVKVCRRQRRGRGRHR